MIKIIEGNCYIFGPHTDGLYSVERVQRVLDDGTIIAYFRGNAHQQRHIPEEVIAEVGCDCAGGRQGRDWFEPGELGQSLTRKEAKAQGEVLWRMRYERWGKYS